MPARILVFLPPSTRTCVFLDSRSIGFQCSWSWWNRHVPLLMFCLCCRWSPLLIQIDIQCRCIGFSYHMFLTTFQLAPQLALLLHYGNSPSRIVSLYAPHHHCLQLSTVACSHLSSLSFVIVFPPTNQSTITSIIIYSYHLIDALTCIRCHHTILGQ